MIAELLAGFGDVGTSVWNIAGLGRFAVEDRFLSKGIFQELDQAGEFHGFGFAKVKDFIAEFLLGAGDDAGEDVGDVSIIASGRAIAEDRNGLAGLDEGGEFTNGEIRPLARTIDSEEAKDNDIKVVDMMINV